MRDIDDALARIEAGTFGLCVSRGRAIEEERVNANLTTTLCAKCSRTVAQEGSEPSEDTPPSGIFRPTWRASMSA